jgi:hypothetical protein
MLDIITHCEESSCNLIHRVGSGWNLIPCGETGWNLAVRFQDGILSLIEKQIGTLESGWNLISCGKAGWNLGVRGECYPLWGSRLESCTQVRIVRSQVGILPFVGSQTEMFLVVGNHVA